MTPAQRVLLAINILGGAAVLGSYAAGIIGTPGAAEQLWGGVPKGLRPVYTVSMLLATLGYFVFIVHLLFRVDPASVALPGGLGFGVFHGIFLLILVPSALWLPLTAAFTSAPSAVLWVGIRLVLAAVGVGSLILLWALVMLRTTAPTAYWWPAVVGAVFFAFQTAVLDAVVWTALFRR
jgi:hypothetical protein